LFRNKVPVPFPIIDKEVETKKNIKNIKYYDKSFSHIKFKSI